jgi:predicted ArsR family transcriptional regulator
MTQQITLFESQVIGAPHNGTATSIEAARQAQPNRQEQTVLAYLKGFGDLGRTQDEISRGAFIPRSAVAARCNALEKRNLIHKDGTRLTQYGRPAAVYKIGPWEEKPP